MKYLLQLSGKSTFVVLLVFCLANITKAQGETVPKNLFEALQQQNLPTRISAKDLTKDWYVADIRNDNSFIGAFASNYKLSSYASLAMISLYFTQGNVFTFSGRDYLVAYQIMPPADVVERKFYSDENPRANNHDVDAMSPILFSDASLSLSLLSLTESQNFNRLKTFDPEKDFVSKPAFEREMSMSNLKQIALVMLMYQQDYDNKLPPMVAARSVSQMEYTSPGKTTPATTVQSRLRPYIDDTKIFLQPITQRPYLPNYNLSGKSYEQLDSPSKVLLLFEDAPDADGIRCVVYADGHAEELTEVEFQKERKAQGISESGYPSAAKPTQKAKATPKT